MGFVQSWKWERAVYFTGRLMLKLRPGLGNAALLPLRAQRLLSSRRGEGTDRKLRECKGRGCKLVSPGNRIKVGTNSSVHLGFPASQEPQMKVHRDGLEPTAGLGSATAWAPRRTPRFSSLTDTGRHFLFLFRQDPWVRALFPFKVRPKAAYQLTFNGCYFLLYNHHQG